jgi:hypothetical protein
MSFEEVDFSSSAENVHEKGSKKAIHISLSQKNNTSWFNSDRPNDIGGDGRR